MRCKHEDLISANKTNCYNTITPDEVNFEKYMRDTLCRDLNICVAPISTHLSQRSQEVLDHSEKQSVNQSLLQVTIGNRALILDLASNYSWIKDFADTQQFLGQEDFVCSEVHIQRCFSQEHRSKTKIYRFLETIFHNHSKDFYIKEKSYRTVEKEDLKDQDLLGDIDAHLLPCKFYGAYNTYSELDLLELKMIRQCIENRHQRFDFDIQCCLSMYRGKSVFAMMESFYLYNVFDKKISHTSFDPDLDEDDNEIENQKLRRLF